MPVTTDSDKERLKYTPVAGHWDEALLPSGLPRRHWRKLFVEIRRMGFRHLSRRWQSGQQLIQSEGVTYNVGNLPDGSEYSWPMDPIPLVIDAREEVCPDADNRPHVLALGRRIRASKHGGGEGSPPPSPS